MNIVIFVVLGKTPQIMAKNQMLDIESERKYIRDNSPSSSLLLIDS